MRQYSRGRRIIAANMHAVILTAALATASAQAQPVPPDHQWYADKSAEAMRQQVMPPVLMDPMTIDGALAISDFRVQPWFEGNSLDLVMVLPTEDITSATVAITGTTASSTSTTSPVSREVPVSIRHLGYVRGHRLAKIQMVTSVPGEPGERIASGRIRVAFGSAIRLSDEQQPHSQSDTNFFHQMLSQLVANPVDLEMLALHLADVPSLADGSGIPIGGYPDAVAHFEIEESGFVQFTGSDLQAAGLDISAADINHVSVWSNDEEQAVYHSGLAEPNRPVRPDDLFRMYARDNDSTYTRTRDYWVRVTDKPALNMAGAMSGTVRSEPVQQSAHFRASVVVEEDVPPVLTKNDQFLTILGFRWVWWTWTPSPTEETPVPNPRSYDTSGTLSFDLPGLTTGTSPASLNLGFYANRWNMNSAPVNFRIQVNGQDVATIAVSEPAGLDHTVTVQPESLKPAGNTLTITPEVASTLQLPEISFDRLEVNYPRSYAMTSSTLEFYPPTENGGAVALDYSNMTSAPVLVADMSANVPRLVPVDKADKELKIYVDTRGPRDRRYLAVTNDAITRIDLNPAKPAVDLLSPENVADLLVISWPEFVEDLQPWVAHRRSQGHAVKVVNVFDVYDQFGFGHESPHAIRAFLRHAMIHWQGSVRGPAASAVVLVGDSTSAYRNEFRNDVINYVPTMRLNPSGDPFASDQWFVSLFGDDAFADALIGRFSVNNRQDLQTIIRKQLDYENVNTPGPWQNTLGFVADHSEFEESIDRIMKQVVPPRFFVDRIAMSELPWVDNYYFPKEIADAREAKVSPEATGRIRDMFNRGASVVTYFGHGSPNIWSNERMWFGGDSPNSDNLMLTNRDKLSIVINMTCNSGAIDYPQPRWNVAISEDFMRVENGGAVACFVPSGPGLTVQHERLMMEIGRLLFDGHPRPLGQTLQLGLWRYLAGGNPPELARMYIYLGDPLLMPNISIPANESGQGRSSGARWPGTVPLPPDIAGSSRGGSYQFKNYNKHVSAGTIGSFTSATVALPLPPTETEAARVVAFSAPGDQLTTRIESTFQPLSSARAIRLVQWRRVDAATDDSTATLEFQLQNEAPLPIHGATIQVFAAGDGTLLAESEPLDIMPQGNRNVKVELHTPPGLTMLTAKLIDGENQQELSTNSSLAVVGLRADDQREQYPPAIIDPRSVSVRYRNTPDGVAATVSGQVHIIAREALSNLRIGLEDETGLVDQDSIMTVPAVKPGENVRISLTTEMPANAPSRQYTIRFDPSGYYPEFSRYPAETVKLGQPHFADVAVGQVLPSDPSPTDGETVFFDVEVSNQGDAIADGVRVEGFHLTATTEPVKLTSQVTLEHPLLTLEPGTTETVRLRWDPFRNAGENPLRFTAQSIYEMPDRTEANDSKDIIITARTKARLRAVKTDVLPLTADDRAKRQVRFLARVKNIGESEAHGLQVRFYSSPLKREEDLLGESSLDQINPGETKDVIHAYQPKPGQEDRQIQLTFEVIFKGSRQRVPMN